MRLIGRPLYLTQLIHIIQLTRRAIVFSALELEYSLMGMSMLGWDMLVAMGKNLMGIEIFVTLECRVRELIYVFLRHWLKDTKWVRLGLRSLVLLLVILRAFLLAQDRNVLLPRIDYL